MFLYKQEVWDLPKDVSPIRNAGLKGLGVSIDGPEDVHDVLRDRVGSFQAGMAAIKRAVDHGFTVTSNTQINQLTKDRLLETADLLEEAGVQIWRSQITVPMGRAADRPEWLLQPYQVIEVVDTLAEAKTKILQKTMTKGKILPKS